MANNSYGFYSPPPSQVGGYLLPETPQEQNLKRQQRIKEHEQRELIRKQKEQAAMQAAKEMWQSLNPAQKVGMSPIGFPFTDAIGLAGDVQMYKENPEMRSAGNYALSGVGLLPFVPGVASTVLKNKPIKAYHGTNKEFKNFKLGEGKFSSDAVFLSKDKSQAKGYGKNIKEVEVYLESPIEIDFGGRSTVYLDGKQRTPSQLAKKISDINKDLSEFNTLEHLDEGLLFDLEHYGFNQLVDDNIDGVVMKNISDPATGLDFSELTTDYIVFDPKKIKTIGKQYAN